MIHFCQRLEADECQQTPTLQLWLSMDERVRSRQRVTLSDGSEAGLFLPRGTVLKEGDILKAETGELAKVFAKAESLSVVSSSDPLLLARACYHLGNRHVPLQITQGQCCYLHDHVLDEMIKGLGLTVSYRQDKFQPEAGAYGGSAHGHSHRNSHGNSHAHSHGNSHGHSHEHAHDHSHDH